MHVVQIVTTIPSQMVQSNVKRSSLTYLLGVGWMRGEYSDPHDWHANNSILENNGKLQVQLVMAACDSDARRMATTIQSTHQYQTITPTSHVRLTLPPQIPHHSSFIVHVQSSCPGMRYSRSGREQRNSGTRRTARPQSRVARQNGSGSRCSCDDGAERGTCGGVAGHDNGITAYSKVTGEW